MKNLEKNCLKLPLRTVCLAIWAVRRFCCRWYPGIATCSCPLCLLCSTAACRFVRYRSWVSWTTTRCLETDQTDQLDEKLKSLILQVLPIRHWSSIFLFPFVFSSYSSYSLVAFLCFCSRFFKMLTRCSSILMPCSSKFCISFFIWREQKVPWIFQQER